MLDEEKKHYFACLKFYFLSNGKQAVECRFVTLFPVSCPQNQSSNMGGTALLVGLKILSLLFCVLNISVVFAIKTAYDILS